MKRAVLLVLAGIPAAVAGASSHRIARNEASTIELLRQLVSAEAGYQSANGGFYDELRCLVAPASCIPRYGGHAFLDGAAATLPPRHGYRFRFHAGAAAGASALPGQSSASSMLRFAITAVPLVEGVTGRRWFCVDGSGFVREVDGGPLAAKEGGCDRQARTVQPPPPSSPEEGESRTIADVRVLVSAQQAYASQNGGFFDRLDCLAEPSRCLPGVPSDTPLFIDPRIAALTERHGYRRRFHPGASAPLPQRSNVSPTSMLSYAYTAVPALPGRTGLRAFCADSRGDVCVAADGREPRVVDAHCEPCVLLH